MAESKFPEWLQPLGVYRTNRRNAVCVSIKDGKRTKVPEPRWQWNGGREAEKVGSDHEIRLKGVKL